MNTKDLEAEVRRLREDNADLRSSSLYYLELAERLGARVRELEAGARGQTPDERGTGNPSSR